MKKLDVNQFKVTSPININEVSTTFDLGISEKRIEKKINNKSY